MIRRTDKHEVAPDVAAARAEQDEKMLAAFVPRMRHELRENAWKGSIAEKDVQEQAEQLLYHAAKAVRAMLVPNYTAHTAREALADVANEAGIAAFSMGLLDPSIPDEKPQTGADDPYDPESLGGDACAEWATAMAALLAKRKYPIVTEDMPMIPEPEKKTADQTSAAPSVDASEVPF